MYHCESAKEMGHDSFNLILDLEDAPEWRGNVHVAEPKPEDPDVEVEVQDMTQQLLGEQNGG